MTRIMTRIMNPPPNNRKESAVTVDGIIVTNSSLNATKSIPTTPNIANEPKNPNLSSSSPTFFLLPSFPPTLFVPDETRLLKRRDKSIPTIRKTNKPIEINKSSTFAIA